MINSYAPQDDALVAAPQSHKLLLENDNLRVVEVLIAPGQKEPMHTHKWKSIMIIDKAAEINYYDSDNKVTKITEAEYNSVKVEWMEPEGLHAVENIDDKPYHAIRIEFKD